MRVVISPSMRHFADDDRYEFDGHALGDPQTKLMVTLKGRRGAELYDKLVGIQQVDGGDMAAENKIELDVDDGAVSFT